MGNPAPRRHQLQQSVTYSDSDDDENNGMMYHGNIDGPGLTEMSESERREREQQRLMDAEAEEYNSATRR